MTQYLISFGAHAMDHIPDQDAPAVARAAHAAVQEAITLVDVPSREQARPSVARVPVWRPGGTLMTMSTGAVRSAALHSVTPAW